MAGNREGPRAREPSGGIEGPEVEARKRTTVADDLGNRASGRLKRDPGRQQAEDSRGDAAQARSKRRARRFADGQETADPVGSRAVSDGGYSVSPSEINAEGIGARKETTLADELGVEASGRLKQKTARQHDGGGPEEGKPTRTRPKRFRQRHARLGGEGGNAGQDAPGAGKGNAGAAASRLKASKGARHALRFADDVGAVAHASVMGEDDGDASEGAVREAGRRIRPSGRAALSGMRKRNAPITSGAAGASAETAPVRLRDGPAFATKAGGKPGDATGAAGTARERGSRLSGFWRRRAWRRSARAQAAARKAATTGETVPLRGLSALKARFRRMFTAGGGGKAAVAIAAAVALAVTFAASALSTCSTVVTGVVQAVAATSYTADDREIKDADAAYTRMEAELEGQAQSAESSHPGYDEYRYQIGELGHDPFALASILTARYGDYTASQVAGFLEDVLDAQYELDFEESTETETVTTVDENGYERTDEVERHILTVRLVNHGLDHAARQLLSPDELASYEATYACKGNRDYLFPKPYAGNYGSTGAGFDWQPPGEAMSDAKFAAMYNEGKKYLGWPYVWGGGSPETGFDCSGFVSWVLTASGVCNTGRQITDGLLSFCSQVSREQARPGDLVFFTGTYETDLKTSHVGIYLGDGMMMHCGDPIQITSIDTPYWQAHLYGFGRIR